MNTSPTPRLEMRDIAVSYGPVQVLHGVDLRLAPAEIHALLGENGAGKSSLMNVLGGVVAPVRGAVAIDGTVHPLRSPREAQRAGVAFIHQELNLINDLDVAENLFLGREVRTAGFRQAGLMRRRAADVLDRLGVRLRPDTLVGTLDAAHKQFVEIARALLFDARVVIMDEPTTALAEHEVAQLFACMRQLRDQGVAMVYISHKLREVTQVCDRYTVLRDGRVVAHGAVADTDEHRLADAMVGAALAARSAPVPHAVGDAMLSVEGLHAPGVHGIDFQVRAGEVVGLTGLAGDGRAELIDTLCGNVAPRAGRIGIAGHARSPRSPRAALRQGLGLVPRNRKESSILKDLTIQQNQSVSALSAVSRWGVVDGRAERARAQAARERLRIKLHHLDDPITSLSGGNQQKVILAKWLATGAPVLVLDNPTQGVDVGAKAEIYPLIRDLAGQGKAVVVSSAEIPELQQVCDRVLVFYRGRIVAELANAQVEEDTVIRCATGVGGAPPLILSTEST
ncbi:MAG: sugar ABC transporter ATP-binding protein [Rhizobacter sp.]